jgi:uncharacterized membrane protein YccC
MKKNWLLHHDRFVHSFKTALAVLIGFVITKSTHLPVDQWLIITILVVMCAQVNVGSMIQKSYMRFLGTLIGSVIALLTLALLGHSTLAVGFSIMLSTILFSYIATSQQSYNEAGTLGVVTVVIILINKDPTLLTAVGRFLEISAGIFIAAFISQFILPIHARYYLRNNQAKTLLQLRSYYLTTLLSKHEPENYLSVDETVVKSLIAQRKLAIDAAREPLGKSYNIKLFDQSLWCEREILRSITFMYHANQASPAIQTLFKSLPSIKEFHEKICQALEKIAEMLEKRLANNNIVLPDLSALQTTIQTATQSMPHHDIVCADSFLFSAEVLLQRIEKLTAIIQHMNQIATDAAT